MYVVGDNMVLYDSIGRGYDTTRKADPYITGRLLRYLEPVPGGRYTDFACGTGTLLSAAYRRISQLHEASGGDAEMIHPEMMATALVGCDVLPAAAHLTASMLAGAHPDGQVQRQLDYGGWVWAPRRWWGSPRLA